MGGPPDTLHTLPVWAGIGLNTTCKQPVNLWDATSLLLLLLLFIVLLIINIITTFKQALALALRADHRDICKSKEIPIILQKKGKTKARP